MHSQPTPYPVGLEGVWDGLVRLELTTRMDYYQNYFKALGVMIVVLYSYEVMTDLRCVLREWADTLL